MGLSQYDPAVQDRRAWNAGRKVGAKRALKPRQIWAIQFFLGQEGRLRNRALFDLAIDSKLRGCDLVKIKIGSLVVGPEIRSRAIVVQQKTGRPVQFELMADARASLLAWLERRGSMPTWSMNELKGSVFALRITARIRFAAIGAVMNGCAWCETDIRSRSSERPPRAACRP